MSHFRERKRPGKPRLCACGVVWPCEIWELRSLVQYLVDAYADSDALHHDAHASLNGMHLPDWIDRSSWTP